MPSIFGRERDQFYMEHALKQAKSAFKKGEVPIGAILVDANGAILAAEHNKTEAAHTQSAHAESLALQKAGKRMKTWRLNGCYMYVTVQPCAMCMALIQLSRCAGVIYGVESPLFGYHLVDNESNHSLYKKDALHIEAGIEAEKAAQIMKDFFEKKRRKT